MGKKNSNLKSFNSKWQRKLNDKSSAQRKRDQPEAVPFAIPTRVASSPICLDVSTENIPVDLVEGFATQDDR